MLELQGKEIGVGRLVDLQVQLVRTYKGEINRTQTGVVAAFPNSFITVGLKLVFQGRRADLFQIQQILLSNDTVNLAVVWTDKYDFSGKFSCTSNEMTELKDEKEAWSQLNVSLVSDGTPITDSRGEKFRITDRTTSPTTTRYAYFGEILTFQTPAYYKQFELPDGKLLVLGSVTVNG